MLKDDAAFSDESTPKKQRLQGITKQWSTMLPADRAKYEEQAATERAKITARGVKSGRSAGVADPSEPKAKRPKSAWNLFQDAKRAEVMAKVREEKSGELEGAELHKAVFRESAGRLSAMWKELSEEEKKAYHPSAYHPTAAGDGNTTSGRQSSNLESVPAANAEGTTEEVDATAGSDVGEEDGDRAPSNGSSAHEQE